MLVDAGEGFVTSWQEDLSVVSSIYNETLTSGIKEKSKPRYPPVGENAFEKAMRSKLLAVVPRTVKENCLRGKEPRSTVRDILLQLYIDAKVSTNPEKSAVKHSIKDPSSGGSKAEDVVKAINSWSLCTLARRSLKCE